MVEKKRKSIINKIRTTNVYDVAIKSPLDYAKNLSRKLDNHIYIKRDDLQPVFSFKLRGAYVKIKKLKRTTIIGLKKFIALNCSNGIYTNAPKPKIITGILNNPRTI